MKKQLGWVNKFGGAEYQAISRVWQTVVARSMESQNWHQLAGLVGWGFRKGTMASILLDASHFSSSLYATGAFQAAILVLELRGCESVYLVVFGYFKRNCLGLQKFLPLTPIPLFLHPEVLGTYFPGIGTLGWVSPCGAGTSHSQDITPQFLYITCGCLTSLFFIFLPPTSLKGCGFLNS